MQNLLVIDDDPLFRSLITGAVERTYHVRTASDGHEGYQTAVESRPDLVVLDLLMPTWGGVETLRAFRTDAELRTIPVLVMTGAEDEPEIAEARGMGISGLLLKSQFEKDLFLEMVEDAIAGGPVECPAGFDPVPVSSQHRDE